MTVAELGRRMSGRELAEWGAFFALEAQDAEEAALRASLPAKAEAALPKKGRRR